jgi:2-iminobutanoate/2-iminopropanoate deaminase
MSTPIGPYTPIVRAGDLLVVSGQLGLIDGQMVSGGVAAETTQALANLAALLAKEGASMGEVIKTTVFLRHMRDFEIMNEAYVTAFGDHRPARSAFAVAELPRVALVEIEAWAYAPSGR